MNESDNNLEGQQEKQGEASYTDPYASESGADIYTPPGTVETIPAVEETVAPVAVVDTHGLFSGNQQQNAETYNAGFGYPNYGGQPPYGNQAQAGFSGQASGGNQTPYGAQRNSGQNFYGNQNPYGNQNAGYGEQPPYAGQPGGYDGQPPCAGQPGGYDGQPPCAGQPGGYDGQLPCAGQLGGYDSGQLPYGGQSSYSGHPSYNSQLPYGNQNAYDSQPSAYGGQMPYGNQSAYGGQAYYNGKPPYGSQQAYGNQAGGGYGGQPPFGGQPPYDNPYSPYAMPPQKQHTGLIVGIVVAIIILFLVAVFALASRAVKMLSEKEKADIRRDVYDFDDDYDYDFNHYDDYDYDFEYDLDDDYGYDDYFYNDYGYGYADEEYDERYYILQQDIKDDLSYQMELTEYEYETDHDNVLIAATIPVISGEDVPNLDKLNEEIRKEVDLVTELFEKEYETHIKEDEESYFGAELVGFVTYMDEDKLSIAYQEELYNDLGGGVYLVSVNIDMKSGVILDNEEMLTTDDKFSVDFRQRSEEQNGEIEYLYYMTDQQITEYFNSENIIVFYTPKGMEIGFNYEEGWVTVTYEDYEQYLKVF